MGLDALDHFGTYEWTGFFWFPEKPDKKFSGKVRYSPDEGIKVELLLIADSTNPSVSDDFSPINRPEHAKILHGSVIDLESNTESISLINVFFSGQSVRWAENTIKTLRCSASYLILDSHIEASENVQNLKIEYEEQLENFFLSHHQRNKEIREYSCQSFLIDNSWLTIVDRSSFQLVYDEHDFDANFYWQDKRKLNSLKSTFLKLNKSKKYLRVKATDLTVFNYKQKRSFFLELFEKERMFREFIEFLMLKNFHPKKIWLLVEYKFEGKRKTQSLAKPVLANLRSALKRKQGNTVQCMLPVNIKSFETIENFNKSLLKWIDVNHNPRMAPLKYWILSLKNRHSSHVAMRYVNLVSTMKYFSGILDRDLNLEKFIEKYTLDDDVWNQEILKLIGFGEKKDVPKNLSKIRDAIEHPNAAIQENDKKKYWKIIQNEFLFENIYTYVSAILLKAILKHLGGISIDAISKFIKYYIDSNLISEVKYQ
ncbi:MAG: hypothetical protein VKJ06_02730 [Vampirovibrionales bacterium]|nr:hypothetical protein [Vampirovibrionales bacterium]